MTLPRFLTPALCVAFAVAAGCTAPADTPEPADDERPPNIVLVMADDLGYGDLGSYGQARIHTPHLDRMAQEGLRFTQFYAGSTVCAPSRDALLTGRHTGHTFVRGNVGPERGDAPLPAADVTMAEVLREEGYATGVFGKWALGLAETSGAPHRQGFDAFFGYEDQSEAHFYYVNQLQTIRGGQTVTVEVDSTDYSHDLITGAAFDFIRAHHDEPFFVYLPVTIPHAEIVAPPEAMARYTEAEGQSVFAPEPFYPGNNQYPANPQPRATFAAMVSHLDDSMGALFALLDSLGVDDDTIVLFTSDNGPHPEGGQEDLEYFDSNGPLRGHKRDLYEGGIRVPLLARWPGVVPSGATTDHPAAAWDLLPTFADLAGVAPPPAVDGRTLVPLLDGSGTPAAPPTLYWEFALRGGFSQALRESDWKVLRFFDEAGEVRVELYDLATDPGETRDVADTHPEVVDRLIEQMDGARRPATLDRFRDREPAALAS